MMAIFRRELSSYFKGILGYLFTAFVLIFAGIYTMAYNLSGAYANFEYTLSAIAFIYLIGVPILSMRTLAEERRQKTDQLLYALPIRLSDVVLGKYLAMLTVLAVPTLVMALYPVAAASVTQVVVLLLYFMSGLADFVSSDASSSLLALVLLALVFALALWMLSKNPIVAALTALVAVGVLLGWYAFDSSACEGLFGQIMTQLSVFDRFYTVVDGMFDLTAVVYDVSMSAVFLFLSVQALEKRRWSE